jgi:Ca2+-binding EF-hand superfamily protein
MLSSLGLDTSHSTISHYLPNGPLNLAAYLTTLSSALSEFSPPEELLAAFAAFDEHDDGCVDVDELSTALMGIGDRMSSRDVDRALDGFTRRRGLNGSGGRGGEVFRYHEFMNVVGGGKGAEEEME